MRAICKSRAPIERMKVIAAKLRDGEHFNLRTLSEELEISRKALQRDLDFMRDRLGYEIVWKQKDLSPEDCTYVGKPPKERVL